MYFSKVQLDLSQRAARECLLELDNPYREHQLLWQLFPHTANRNFLFARATGGAPVYYVVSEGSPAATSPAWLVETRDYNPQLSEGDQLSFRLRANPVAIQKIPRSEEQHRAWLKQRKTKGLPEISPGKVFPRRIRHDVVMQAKRDMGWKSLPEDRRPSLAELIHRTGLEWLTGRESRNGFRLHPDSVQVDGYHQQRFEKKDSRPIVFSSLELQGMLTVTNPGDFIKKALFEGIGPAKAFGCGLLLVRRI